MYFQRNSPTMNIHNMRQKLKVNLCSFSACLCLYAKCKSGVRNTFIVISYCPSCRRRKLPPWSVCQLAIDSYILTRNHSQTHQMIQIQSKTSVKKTYTCTPFSRYSPITLLGLKESLFCCFLLFFAYQSFPEERR